MTTLLARLQQQLSESLASNVEVGLDAIGMGLFTADGRQVATVVRETVSSHLELSDGGETWSDLWMDGCVGSSPTPTIRAKLEQLCGMYGVAWDQKTLSIVCLAAPSKFSDAARRIASASIAIDGWRLWLTNQDETAERPGTIVDGVRSIASRRHWEFEDRPYINGRKFPRWRAHALLSRPGRSAALTFLDDGTYDKAMQRMAGWVLDTTTPLVFVVPPRIANDIDDAMFADRAIILPRQKTGMPETIMAAVEKIAA
jgi:Domain of unknown function DUF1828